MCFLFRRHCACCVCSDVVVVVAVSITGLASSSPLAASVHAMISVCRMFTLATVRCFCVAVVPYFLSCDGGLVSNIQHAVASNLYCPVVCCCVLPIIAALLACCLLCERCALDVCAHTAMSALLVVHVCCCAANRGLARCRWLFGVVRSFFAHRTRRRNANLHRTVDQTKVRVRLKVLP